MDAENKESCLQKDSAEHEGYVRERRSFHRIWKERDSAQPELLEKILNKDNLNRAFKRVNANKGAPGIDGITVDEVGAYLRENQKELIERIKRGKYTPDPVRRVEIPKPDGEIRKLGIPTVKDRIFQQAITQQLMPVYELLFSDNSYGYRPGRDAKDAITKVKGYAEQGYTHAVALDLSKYFDTLNHERLLNILRRNVKDERVIQWIKRYLKSGVMENGVVMDTEEGSPQGGNISPLLAKSERVAKRLLETSTKYLEETLKLKVNQEKSRGVSVFAIRNFKFLGFTLGKNGKGIYVRVHGKSWKKMKSKLKELSSRRTCQSIHPSLEKIKVFMRGWLNYYGIADMRKRIDTLNSWLYHRIRMCIWKQWKLPKTKKRNLMRLGIPEYFAHQAANSRKKYWYVSGTGAVNRALTKERLINSGFYDLAIANHSLLLD